MRLLAAAVLLLCTACWNPRYFAPREYADATGPGGMPAANYAIAPGTADGQPTAELRVWSRGAKARFTDDDREVVELHVGFELENNGAVPLQLDLGSIVCEELMLDDELQPHLVPVRLDGDGTALPNSIARVDAIFEPATTHPSDIDGFAVRFRVGGDGGVVLQQLTPFDPWWRSRGRDRASDWGWGWGWGFGLGIGLAHPHWH
jgi:hypothetical protein